MARLAIAALVVALAAGGCGRDTDVGARQQGMGLDWGGGGGSTAIDSDLADPTVAFLGEITHPDMRAPARVSTAPDGTIAVSDLGARAVFLFTPNARLKVVIPVPQPLGVATDDQGRIYVGDVASGSVQIFDADGAYLGAFGAGAGEFEKPGDLAWDPTEARILVADSKADRVRVFATTGAPLFDFGSTGSGPGQFYTPTGVVVDDAGGRYFVVDNQNARVQVFDRAGAFLSEFGEYGSNKKEFNRPGGLALDGVGRLYVTDAFQSTLQVVDTEGLHVSYLGEAGHLYGQLRLTTDAVIDPFNRLLVASYRTSKVVVYGIDDYTTPPPDIVPLVADVSVEPATLSPLSHAPWVTAYIEAPEGDIHDLNADSVRLQGLARDPGTPAAIGDHDEDGTPDLALKFLYADLLAALATPGTHTITLTGDFNGGGTLEGTATVTLVDAPVPAAARGGAH